MEVFNELRGLFHSRGGDSWVLKRYLVLVPGRLDPPKGTLR